MAGKGRKEKMQLAPLPMVFLDELSSLAIIMKSPALRIRETLQGKHLFITGATGFLGLALVEKLLRHVPDCQLTLLVRSASHAEALERFRKLISADPLFASLPMTALARVRCLAGDITLPQLGLDDAECETLRGSFDLCINSAASVDFDEPLDEALRINIAGPLAVQAFAAAVGADLLQISTAYVCGLRAGLIPDDFDVAAVPNAAGSAAQALEELQALAQQQYTAHGHDPASRATTSKKLTLALMTLGREVANAKGWSDIYTYTKFLSERLLAEHRGTRALGIFRPTIVESAAGGPCPGWLKGVKVMDMVLAAYGKGMIPGLPVDLGAPLDIIPVDMVAGPLLAQAAQMLCERDPQHINLCQLGSSAPNPLLLGHVAEYTYAHYKANPLPDARGRPVLVKKPRFPLLKNHVLWLERYQQWLTWQQELLQWKLFASFGDGRRSLVAKQKNVKRYLALAKMFGSYARTRRQFSTARADALFARLSAEEQALFNFAHADIDWRHYMLEQHLPSLDKLIVSGGAGAAALGGMNASGTPA